MIEAIKNVLLFAGLMGIGGMVFVATGMFIVRAFDFVENDYE
jgi:hypothetical protein